MLDGVVTSAIQVDKSGNNPGHYAWKYVIQGQGDSHWEHVAYNNYSGLPSELKVGTRIKKQKGELGYTLDGIWIPFPVQEFIKMLLWVAILPIIWPGILLIAIWFFMQKRTKSKPQDHLI